MKNNEIFEALEELAYLRLNNVDVKLTMKLAKQIALDIDTKILNSLVETNGQ